MRYVFHPAALTEYAEAVQFYTDRRIELAQAFINAVEDAIFRLVQLGVNTQTIKQPRLYPYMST